MKIGIASDHRGYHLKEEIKKVLNEYEMIDYGTMSEDSVDYPDYAFKLGEAIKNQKVDFGIAICGSGIGMSIACNKVKGVRCARVVNKQDAYITRVDNDANIIALSEELSLPEAIDVIHTFLTTPFSEEEKHKKRIQKIARYEDEC